MFERSLAVFVLLFAGAATAGPPGQWGYEEDNGPEHWEGICRTGRSQSPIDIHAADVEYAPLHRLHFVHYDHRNLITVTNNGYSITAAGFSTWLGKQPYITNGGLKHKYKLEQFHLHWSQDDYHGSEHTIGGLYYPAELHLVHHREDLPFNEAVKVRGGLAVVGIFLMIGDESRPTEAISSIINEVLYPGNVSEIHGFHPRRLIPAQHEAYYRYDGSLTTPGCFESVIWTVLAEPISITRKQMDELRQLRSLTGKPHTYNYRPTQPINGRKVLYRPSHFDRALLCGSADGSSLLGSLVFVAAILIFGRQ